MTDTNPDYILSLTARHLEGGIGHPEVIEGCYTITAKDKSNFGPITVSLKGCMVTSYWVYLGFEDGDSIETQSIDFIERTLVVSMLEYGTAASDIYTWPFMFELPDEVTMTWTDKQLYKGPSRGVTSPLPPSRAYMLNCPGNLQCNSFIRYSITVDGPKLRGNIEVTTPNRHVKRHRFKARERSSMDVKVISRTATPQFLADISRQESNVCNSKHDIYVYWEDPVNQRLSYQLQQADFEVSVRFPRSVEIHSPRPFPCIVELKIPNVVSPHDGLVFPQIELADFRLKIGSITNWMKYSCQKRKIVEKEYAGPSTMEFSLNKQSNKRVATLNLETHLALSVPTDEDFFDSCPSFKSDIWEQRYVVTFAFHFRWNGGSVLITSPGDALNLEGPELMLVPPNQQNSRQSGVAQANSSLPPSYESVVEEGVASGSSARERRLQA